MRVTEVSPCRGGKVKICLDSGISFSVFRRESEEFDLREDAEFSETDWNRIREEILDPRAKKRALHLLEQMDRTESQLRRKLEEGGYPQESIDAAVAYAASYHYLDDRRYAETYIRCHQLQKSRLQMKAGLLSRGITPEQIAEAFDEACEVEEEEVIRKLLSKKHYDAEHMDGLDKQKIWQYLMRRGFSSSAVRHCMENG